MATMSEHVELLESLRLMTAERNRLSTESEARAQDVGDLQDKNEQSKAELARYENGRLVMVNEIARLREEIRRLTAVETAAMCDLCTPERKCPDHGACVTDGEI